MRAMLYKGDERERILKIIRHGIATRPGNLNKKVLEV
jgi:hypothetical protein